MAGKKGFLTQETRTLRAEDMHSAIAKLERRLSELESFDSGSLLYREDPRLQALSVKLDDTISEIFGHGTTEYNRFAPQAFDQAGWNWDGSTSLRDVIQSVEVSRIREITNLRTIIEIFRERLSDGADSPTAKSRRAFGDLDLHPEIARACSKLFENGHYSEAIESGCKVLDMLVKMRSMRPDVSGTELMQLVFSQKSPILKYNEQTNDSEKSEQQGMMFLFAGAMLAFRNPRAHGLLQDNPENAVEILSFLSMLAKSLDRTVK